MQKIAISRSFGGFNFSQAAYRKMIEYGMKVTREPTDEEYAAMTDETYLPRPIVVFDRFLDHDREKQDNGADYPEDDYFHPRYFDDWRWHDEGRVHPVVIKVIEELGADAGCPTLDAFLAVVEVPDDIKWHIHSENNWEHVAENHRTWGEDVTRPMEPIEEEE